MHSPRHSGRVTLTQIIVTTLVAGALAAGGAVSTSASARAQVGALPSTTTAGSGGTEPQVQSLRVGTAQSSARSVAGADSESTSGTEGASLELTRTERFSLVGLTWKPGTEPKALALEVRTRTGGVWSDWTALDVEDAPVDDGAQAGSEPLWVGPSDGVAVRATSATGAAPTGLRVALVDPGTLPAASAARTAPSAGATREGSPAFITRPAMVRRAGWGAPKPGSCDAPRVANRLKGVVLHHTAGSNTYTRAQAASVVRSIALYHLRSQHWCDIGYNFLVDRFGTVYEGRAGGTNLPVRGAHAGNFDVNTYTSGISMMGNFEKTTPSAAMKTAVVRLIGWKLATNYLPAKDWVKYGSKNIARISPHRGIYLRGLRPATSTACPGAKAMTWLRASGGLRDRVARYIADYTSPIKTRSRQLGTGKVGYVRAGEYPVAGGRKTTFTKATGYWKRGLGTSFLFGPIRARYSRLGDVGSVLGFTSSGIRQSSRSDMTYAAFVDGRIYNRKGTTYALWGPILDRYSKLGNLNGRLGRPRTTRIKQSSRSDMTYAAFVDGRVYNRKGTTYALWGPILDRYSKLGNLNGRLGRPVTSVYATTTGQRARFEHGDLRWSRSTGRISVRYS